MEECIQEFPNYSVSSFGNIKNNISGKLLKGHNDGRAYLKVDLSYNNIKKRVRIHQLVASTFIDNPENKNFIDHIDKVKHNNNINNLRFATPQENSRNKNKIENTSSKYKGVYFDRTNNKWKCQIFINNINKHLGYFETEQEGAKYYNNYIIMNNMEHFYVLNDIN